MYLTSFAGKNTSVLAGLGITILGSSCGGLRLGLPPDTFPLWSNLNFPEVLGFAGWVKQRVVGVSIYEAILRDEIGIQVESTSFRVPIRAFSTVSFW